MITWLQKGTPSFLSSTSNQAAIFSHFRHGRVCLRTNLLLPIPCLLTNQLSSGSCSLPLQSDPRHLVAPGLRSSSTELFIINKAYQCGRQSNCRDVSQAVGRSPSSTTLTSPPLLNQKYTASISLTKCTLLGPFAPTYVSHCREKAAGTSSIWLMLISLLRALPQGNGSYDNEGSKKAYGEHNWFQKWKLA